MFNVVIYTVETCKKRWKYLRERYVSQRKSLDTPFEHLSRPYLEKMKFLDQHIQPRKSYRNIPNFLTSPTSANSSHYSEYNVDSQSNKSNNSQKNMSHFGGDSSQNHHYHQQQATDQHQQQDTMNALSSAAASALENVNGQVKIEAEIFQNFAAAVASQQLQHISQSAAAAAGLVDSSQGYQEPYRDNTVSSVSATQNSAGSTGGLTSTSSSMKSPLSSPLTGIDIGNGGQDQEQVTTPSAQQHPPVHSSSSVDGMAIGNTNMEAQEHGFNHKRGGDSLHSSTANNYHAKRPRLLNSSQGQQQHQQQQHQQQQHSSNGSHYVQDSDDEFDDNSIDLEPTKIMQHDNHYSNSINMQRNAANTNINNNNNNNNQQQQQQQQNMFPSNTDFLFQLYQQLPHQTGSSHSSSFGKFQTPSNPSTMQRSSEHLLGELVTTELLKMNKDRRKNVQKRILEILFFDD